MMSSSNRVWWSGSQLNNIEDWMEVSYGMRKHQLIGIASNVVFDWVGPQVMV